VELLFDSPITDRVFQELFLPVFNIAFRHRGVPATIMPMPETSMDEDGDPKLGENKIRLAWEGAII
jgi:hypothetical protein